MLFCFLSPTRWWLLQFHSRFPPSSFLQLAAPVHPIRVQGPVTKTICQGTSGHTDHSHRHERPKQRRAIQIRKDCLSFLFLSLSSPLFIRVSAALRAPSWEPGSSVSGAAQRENQKGLQWHLAASRGRIRLCGCPNPGCISSLLFEVI